MSKNNSLLRRLKFLLYWSVYKSRGSRVHVDDRSYTTKARFKRRILHAPNAIQTMHNEEAYLIIYCLNCIRCMQNSTFETGLIQKKVVLRKSKIQITKYKIQEKVCHITHMSGLLTSSA